MVRNNAGLKSQLFTSTPGFANKSGPSAAISKRFTIPVEHKNQYKQANL